MFTQSCFIRKDTQELRDKLKEIGLQPHPCIMPKSCAYLFVNRGFYSRNEIGYQEEIERAIDCKTNENLFLALSALKNNSDKNQWFVLDEDYGEDDYGFLKSGSFHLCKEDNYNIYFPVGFICHKATVNELIKYFNNESI